MKRILNIFIAISLLISVFDIIDVGDITLANDNIFTSSELCANQDNDSLQETLHSSVTMIELNKISPRVQSFETYVIETNFMQGHISEYNKYVNNLERPPKVS